MIPLIIFNQRLRPGEDGCYRLVRRHKKAEAYLDEKLERVAPLTWMERISEERNKENLSDVLKDKTILIVGKGPSLDLMSGDDLDEADVIIAINESILKVEEVISTYGWSGPIYGLQVDHRVTKLPVSCQMITSREASVHYEDSIIVSHTMYGSLSIEVAAGLCREFGAAKARLFAFDGSKRQLCGYADCIGKDPVEGGDPKRFLHHKKRIEKAFGDMPFTFV